jgi:hypothetical protein
VWGIWRAGVHGCMKMMSEGSIVDLLSYDGMRKGSQGAAAGWWGVICFADLYSGSVGYLV